MATQRSGCEMAKEVAKCTWRSHLTFLDKVTWSANEFISTNERPRYQTKSSESAVQTLHLFQSDAGVCESVVSDVVRRDVDKYIL